MGLRGLKLKTIVPSGFEILPVLSQVYVQTALKKYRYIRLGTISVMCQPMGRVRREMVHSVFSHGSLDTSAESGLECFIPSVELNSEYT